METIFLKQKTKMNKLKIFVFAVAVFLLGLTLQTVFYAFNYSTVYLMTGDIYFGRYLPFPFYTMFDTWVLQRDSNNQAFLARADKMIWQPMSFIRFNPREIVFSALLSKQSVVSRTIQLNQGSDEVAVPLFNNAPVNTPSESISPTPTP